MKVLTLWQPHASLCVTINPATGEPYKTIETRGWKPPASLIGQRLAIHAAQRVVYGQVGEFRCETYFSDVQHVTDRCYCDEGEVGPPCTRGAARTPCLTREGVDPIMLPLGVIVATCTLVDVVPMVDASGCKNATKHLCIVNESMLLHSRLDEPWADGQTEHIVSDQRPYGLFEPGRYALPLADVVSVDPPVPFKGGQGLTRTWEPEGDVA